MGLLAESEVDLGGVLRRLALNKTRLEGLEGKAGVEGEGGGLMNDGG